MRRNFECLGAVVITPLMLMATLQMSVFAEEGTGGKPASVNRDERSVLAMPQASARLPNPDGVFRYDIFDETAGTVSVADSISIVYGRYRAYFGQGPAAVYHIETPHKELRLLHTAPNLVGHELDMSRSYKEEWEGLDTRVIRHIGVAGGRKDHVIRRTLSRIPVAPSELDGAWSVEMLDLSDGVPVPGAHIVVRYGDHVGLFTQEKSKPLHAVYARELVPNEYKVLFSTRGEEVDEILDFSTEHESAWSGERWVDSYRATGRFQGKKGHQIRRVFSRMLD